MTGPWLKSWGSAWTGRLDEALMAVRIDSEAEKQESGGVRKEL